MNGYRDPELDDVLQDDQLRRIATLLSSAQQPEPPLDDAFRSGLRRELMKQAWDMAEGRRDSWWRRAFQPPGLAWAGAAVGLVLIASVVTLALLQPAGGLQQVIVASPIDGSNGVALQQPILVAFNQPMDHQATQDAVSITPATSVTFSWEANTLAVTPSAGTLAPNTQYQVTIGSGARTAAGQPLSSAQTITFVTQPPAAPTPAPTPKPTPVQGLGEKQLAPLGASTTAPLQWSADSSTIYFVNSAGALEVVSTKGGSVTVVAPDGVLSPSISPAGDRLAYIRGGKLEVLTFATGHTDEVTPATSPLLVGWAKDALVWAAADAIYTQGATGPSQLAALPTTGTITPDSIAPDGAHVAYQQDQNLQLLDVASGKSVTLGQPGDTFLGWSPDGTQLLYAGGGATVVSDLQGNTTATLAPGEASWSTQDAVLLGGETSLYQVRPDGSNQTRLSNGTYRSPEWAPNGTTFAFFRGGLLWSGTAPALPPEPTVLDQASAVVNSFMDARLNKLPDAAGHYLDDNGKQAYASGGLSLTITGDPSFNRYYILTQEVTGSAPDTTRFVVRLVLSHGKLDVSETEETLVLVRDATTKQFLIDQATAGPQRDLGKGPEVVGVDVSADTIKITFDSDLDPATIAGGIVLVDANGQAVTATPTYASKTVTITGLDLRPGARFRLQVLTALRDVLGHNVAGEYDLDIFGPVLKNHSNHHDAGAAAQSPDSTSPSPGSASPSPGSSSPSAGG